jgi:hypothetical protein
MKNVLEARKRHIGGPLVDDFAWIFKGDKNPQHTFLRMGSKAGRPMSYDFTAR